MFSDMAAKSRTLLGQFVSIRHCVPPLNLSDLGASPCPSLFAIMPWALRSQTDGIEDRRVIFVGIRPCLRSCNLHRALAIQCSDIDDQVECWYSALSS